MPIDRRTALQTVGTAGLAALAGCPLLSTNHYEYTLTVDSVDQSLADYALYDPDEESLFDTAARDALDAILPDGRHTTYGYEPLPTGAYVEDGGRYYQTAAVVTGRERMERTLVRADLLELDSVSAETVPLDSLSTVSRRIVENLHEYHATDGAGHSTDLLWDGAYVLRRPAELDSAVTDEIDDATVAVDPGENSAYRVSLATERITERVVESFAVAVAEDSQTFSDVVLATRIDAEVEGPDLDPGVREALDDVVETGETSETTPLTPSFEGLLERLGLGDVDVGRNGQLLWYDERLYRYGLYVSPAN
ncbi:hypothetical protein OB920_06700 [Halobacteria archaeon HArc-gm2]|nr:hypothetical protein [Halobacteria archaeon HArc-gm2]